jgi:succinoglycan biosynthesis transport protein ExoP
MLSHFVDLLRLSRRQIAACALIAGLIAYALSQLLLEANPIYEASISITMQPSEEELIFNRTFMGVSQFNPATIITQSHIERLLSRPVAERALDMLLAKYGKDGMAEPPTTFGRVKAAFWRTWNTLNYGYHVQPTPRDQLVTEIQQSLDIEIVEGSYILNITVSYDDPEIAAEVANVIAKAYAETASADFLQEAQDVVATISEQEEATKRLLGERRAIREEKSRLIGVNEVSTERTVALEARQTAREGLRDARIALEGRGAELDGLRELLAGVTDPALIAELNQDIVHGEADLKRLARTVSLREQALTEIESSLDDLQRAEQDLAEIDLAVQEAALDLEELQRRRIALDLATKAKLSQVRVINPAVVPVYPAFPKVLLNTIVATFVGAVLALVPVFALDVLGDRVRTRHDLEQVVGRRWLPTLGRRALGRPPAGGRFRSFATALGRRRAADARTPAEPIVVTGALAASEIADLGTLVAAALGREASGGVESSVEALPPVTSLDWAEVRGKMVVIGLPAGEFERSEVEGLLKHAEAEEARPYFVLVA